MLHKVPAIAKGEEQHGHAHHRGLQGCRKGVSQNRDQQTQYTKDFWPKKTALRRGHMISHGRKGISKNSPNRLTGFLYVFCRCSMHLSRRWIVCLLWIVSGNIKNFTLLGDTSKSIPLAMPYLSAGNTYIYIYITGQLRIQRRAAEAQSLQHGTHVTHAIWDSTTAFGKRVQNENMICIQ